MSEHQYKYLTDEDTIQAGDEFWAGSAWLGYDENHIGKFVHIDPSRRPIANANEQPQRERIAYEELRPGDVIQAGDEHRNADGRWHAYDLSLCGSRVHGAWDGRARRPYKISAILEIGDALAGAQKAATQLQNERNEFQTALIESRLALKRKVAEVMEVCKERDEARRERDLARAEVARLSTELWARKPLEDRVTSLTEELTQAREANQQLLQTIADNADQFADAGKLLEQQRDEARAERDKLKGLIDDLLDEPTARQVRDMLRTWAIELDWSADCFDSASREQIDIIQKTLIAVIERVESLCSEGNDDN